MVKHVVFFKGIVEGFLKTLIDILQFKTLDYEKHNHTNLHGKSFLSLLQKTINIFQITDHIYLMFHHQKSLATMTEGSTRYCLENNRFFSETQILNDCHHKMQHVSLAKIE